MPSLPMRPAAALACMSIRSSFGAPCREVPAREFAAQVMDISVFLAQLGLESPPPLPEPLTAGLSRRLPPLPCPGHHGRTAALLAAIPNVTLAEIPEGELCCGSAGTYNLEQPDLAQQIGERKARNILSTGAAAIATGNIGCMTQIQNHLAALGQPLPIWHTIEVLDRAYEGAA